MKKLALVLGSLLVVGTAASAKEVMPAPVVVPEKVVEIVEKPVIVYRDREVAPKWRPSGSVDVQYRYYGNTENKEYDKDGDGKAGKKTSWARKENDYGRLQTIVDVNFTEKQTLSIRGRYHNRLKSENRAEAKSPDELRLRHFYKFGNLGDSKVTATSRLNYTLKSNDGGKYAEASVAFGFADYLFSNDYFKVSKFDLRPVYGHNWSGHGDDASSNRYGLSLETEYELPLGFGLEFNVHGRHDRKLKNNRYDYNHPKKKTKSDTYAEIELLLTNSVNLYKTNAFALNLDFEGGYDTYDVHKKKMVYTGDDTAAYRTAYSLSALPTFGVTYNPTEFVKLYANVGAEYRNWQSTTSSEARNWRWQPTAWAGMKVTF